MDSFETAWRRGGWEDRHLTNYPFYQSGLWRRPLKEGIPCPVRVKSGSKLEGWLLIESPDEERMRKELQALGYIN